MWVFGYGSLMWNPGFPVAARQVAVLYGWRRSFCMRSVHHRGTPDAPGLVLALDRDRGAQCHGVAFQVTPGAEAETLAGLRERELVSAAYLENWLAVTLTDGAAQQALAYVIDPDHVQYCDLDLEDQAQIIARATGGRGSNRDYLNATAQHLAELDLADPDLNWLVARVSRLPQM